MGKLANGIISNFRFASQTRATRLLSHLGPGQFVSPNLGAFDWSHYGSSLGQIGSNQRSKHLALHSIQRSCQDRCISAVAQLVKLIGRLYLGNSCWLDYTHDQASNDEKANVVRPQISWPPDPNQSVVCQTCLARMPNKLRC